LALSITESFVGISYASTPKQSGSGKGQFRNRFEIFDSYDSQDAVHKIDPIPYMPAGVRRSLLCRKDETNRLADQIYGISMDVKASGFLVSWPLTAHGKMGGECGKVLHVLDALAERVNGPVISPHRPLSLWDLDSERRNTLVCNAEKVRRNPLKSWLLSEKMAKKVLERKQQDALYGLPKVANKDESDIASMVLQEFIDLNWKPMRSQLPRKEAEAQMIRNCHLNASFDKIDDLQDAQLRLLM